MVERVAGRPDPGEAVHERLPHAAEGRQVQTTRGRVREVVEVDAGRETQRTDGLVERGPRGRRATAWIAGDSELPCAVRGS